MMDYLPESTLETFVLESINRWAGLSPSLDGAMRGLAVFGGLPLIISAVWTACCAAEARRRRAGWMSLAAAATAWAACLGLQHLFYRSRPFVSLPIYLLVGYPNDASFPSLQAAASAALGTGLFAYGGKARWGIPPCLILLGLSRLFCGIEYPLDILSAWLIGALSALAMIFLGDFHRFAESTEGKRLGFAGICIVVLTFVMAWRLPGSGVRQHFNTYKPRASSGSGENHGILKGYTPAIEKGIAQALAARPLPGPVLKVGAADNGFIHVASVKFMAGHGTRRFPLRLLEKEALEIILRVFRADPRIEEVDVWGTMPSRNTDEPQIMPVIYSVAARRQDARFLLSGKPLKMGFHQAISGFGMRHYLSP